MKGFLYIAVVLLVICGCEPSPAPADQCGPECTAGGPPPPSGYDPETTCYDGCNWCECTTHGVGFCTARLCTDGGF